MTREFWRHADAIVKSTRRPWERGFDAARERLAAEAREQRHMEMMAEAPAPSAASIEISSA
jgi:hypothetical protein